MHAQPAKAHVLGRLWFYDDEPTQIDVWEHEFIPMDRRKRSGADWCEEHLRECYTDEQLRALLDVPAEGNFQVIFKGTISGRMCGYESPEWDEDIAFEEIKSAPIPDEFMKSDLEEVADDKRKDAS